LRSEGTGRLAFLNSVDISHLKKTLHAATSDSIAARIAAADRSTVYAMLFALYGFDILYERALRRLLLDTLSTPRLEALCERFDRSTVGKRYDLVLTLARIPWRGGTDIVAAFGEIFEIPRAFLPDPRSTLPSTEVLRPFRPPPALFDYQISAGKTLLERLTQAGSAGMLQLPTGAGKTRTTLHALVRWLVIQHSSGGRRNGIIWMAHTQELCEQAFESFARVWVAEGTGEVSIVRFWADHAPPASALPGSVMIAGYMKLANLRNTDAALFHELASAAGVLVVDEAHKALAPTVRKTLEAIKTQGGTSIIGLTATPGRGMQMGRENSALADLFGEYLISPPELGGDPIKTLQDRGILATVNREVVETHVALPDSIQGLTADDRGEFDLAGGALKELARNEERNELILQIVKRQITLGKATLVFTCTADQAKSFALQLASDGASAAFVSHDMRRGTRSQIVEDFRSGKIGVLFNYGVLTAGFDAPNVETIVIARPTTSVVLYSQMLGRGLRGKEVGGTPNCTVVDVRDNVENYPEVGELYKAFERYWQRS